MLHPFVRLFARRTSSFFSACIYISFTSSAQPIITIDPSTVYQTINGWEAVTFASQDSPAFPAYRDELLRRAVNEAGITRIRLEVRSGAENSTDYWTRYQQGQIDYATWRANRYATVNDNSDPNAINPTGFHFSELSSVIEKIVLPLRAVTAANGESLYVNLNYVAFTSQIQGGTYGHANPAEYAEFILAAFQHIDQRYGFVPDAVEILLEPDNVSQWNGNLIGRALVAVNNRLKAAGYSPELIAPSCTSMANAITYFDELVKVSGAAEVLSELAYHRYAGVSDTNLRTIAFRAQQRGLRTSMLEWWSDSNGHGILHADLKTGNNSAWEHGVLAGVGAGLDNSMTLFRVNDSNPAQPVVTLNTKSRLTRQYYRFVRPGARRIGAQSPSGTYDPLAFVNFGGETVVVVKASAAGTFNVRNLPAGTYAITYTTPTAYNVKLPDRIVSDGQDLATSIPRDGVLTVFTRKLRVSEPVLRDGRFAFSVSTLSPDANLIVQRSSNPADPKSWTTAGSIVMTKLRAEWSDAIPENELRHFYRVMFQ